LTALRRAFGAPEFMLDILRPHGRSYYLAPLCGYGCINYSKTINPRLNSPAAAAAKIMMEIRIISTISYKRVSAAVYLVELRSNAMCFLENWMD
jgi:hypothetical protein